MDDPWGSPWADESSHPLPNVDTTTKRPVTPDKQLSLQHATTSPWGDDGGFGDWAEAPTNDEPGVNDVANGDNKTSEWGPETAEPDVPDDLGNETTHTWFTRENTLADAENQTIKSPMFNTTEASQDPWAGAVSILVEEELEASDEIGRKASDATLTPIDRDEIAHLGNDIPIEYGGDAIEAEKEHIAGDDVGRVKSPSSAISTSSIGISQLDFDTPTKLGEDIVERTVVQNELHDNGKPTDTDSDDLTPTAAADNENYAGLIPVTSHFSAVKDALQNDSPMSRPSSSPSDHSQHDEVAESPRTSFEEEPKRPKLEREGSSKVKQLVQLFEGIAVVEDDSESTKTAQVEKDVENVDDVEEDFGDFGDFEEGNDDDTADDDPSDPERELSTAVSAREINTPAQPPAPTQLESSSTREADIPAKDHGPVEFNVDLSRIDKVFSEKDQVVPALNLDARSLDIDNTQETFSTIEERKVWYRISRYGTMRKHNTGDDDYVRINWSSSKVREETLKFVSKWMEEDRIGGGVILGGANRFGSMFGWGDKDEAPLTLESAFAARKAQRRSSRSRSRKSSMHSTTAGVEDDGPAEHRRRRSSQSSIFKKKDSIEAATDRPGPHFGWSTSQPSSAVSETTLSILPPTNSSAKSSQPLQPLIAGPPPANSQAFLKALTHSQKPDLPTTLNDQNSQSDDQRPTPKSSRPAAIDIAASNNIAALDDDWGEMVASPVVHATPSAGVGQLGHKTSRSVVDILSPILSSNASTPRNPQVSMSMVSATLSPTLPNNAFVDSISQPPQNQKDKEVAPSADAWASADFSFFDAPVTKPAPPAPTTKLAAPRVTKAPQNQGSQQTITPSVKRTPYQMSSKDVEKEEENIVKGIVKNLPDLSYMLRR